MVVLAEALGLAIGIRTWQSRQRDQSRALRRLAAAGLAVALLAISLPLWSGSLYPLGYSVPARWTRAAAALDAHDPDARILAVPGGTGGNYRWGMRSPDDLFPSFFGRSVVVRNSVVGRGDPAGNFLAGFDTAMAQGALQPGATSTIARYLGASDVLVRNDLLSEEIGGAAPSTISAQVAADPDLALARTYGHPGTDTMPTHSGPATRTQRALDPLDAAVHPLEVYSVLVPEPVVRAAPVTDQVLVDGDGGAFPVLAGLGILDGRQPVRYLGDLDQAELERTVHEGARVVLTDTNRRRAWDINRVANATSPTLSASGDIDAGNGATVTLWPDDASKQTVTFLQGGRSIVADRPGFGLQPFGRPSHAFDGDPTTSWLTGGLGTARGNRIRLTLNKPRTVRRVVLQARDTEPSRISLVEVRLGNTTQLQQLPPGGGEISVPVPPTWTDQVTITILRQTRGENPVGISEVQVDDLRFTEVTRLPDTLGDLLEGASQTLRSDLLDRPLDLVFTRAQGAVDDPNDDEEFSLDRRFTLPDSRSFTLTARLGLAGVDRQALAAARKGKATCRVVAALDGEPVRAKIVSSAFELIKGVVRVEGCDPIPLGYGRHDLRGIFGWRFDEVRLSSPGPRPPKPTPQRAATVHVLDQTATMVHLRADQASGDRYLRLGQAYDARWTLSVDGKDAGTPILLDGYSVGWRIDGDPHDLVVRFAPQGAVRGTFVVSAAAVVGVVAIAVWPGAAPIRRRRRGASSGRRAVAAGGAGGGG